MKLFALETDMDRLTRSLLSADEDIIIRVHIHGFVFFMKVLQSLFIGIPFIIIGYLTWLSGVALSWVIPVVLLVWFLTIIWPLVTSFIDWHFDVVMVTTEKLVVINQSSIFHAEIRQMNLDNIATVNASTQMWNIFPFGILCFDLKEGTGTRFCLRYIPHAARISTIISDAVTLFQRRRAMMIENAKAQAQAADNKPT